MLKKQWMGEFCPDIDDQKRSLWPEAAAVMPHFSSFAVTIRECLRLYSVKVRFVFSSFLVKSLA